MRRFHPKIVAPPHSNLPFEVVMVESVDGDLVLYSDHAAELARVEAANALLRAECEAWRKWFDAESSIELDEPLLYQAAVNARSATDAAGILKGAE